MQVFNRKSGIRTTLLFLAAVSCVPVSLNAQNATGSKNIEVAPVTMPSMPSVAMPSVPSIASPAEGSSFFTPGITTPGVPKNDVKKMDETTLSVTAAAALEQKELSRISNLGADSVSASELTALAQNGYVSNLSSLFNGENGKTSPEMLSLLSGKNLSLKNTVDTAKQKELLEQIITELSEIKKQQQELLSSKKVSVTNPSMDPPAILRFVIGSTDVLSSCRQIFFSEKEDDGSFLLTGDARTLVNGKPVNETFYLLFSVSGTSNSRLVYSVTPTIIQDSPVETPLKLFCTPENIEAVKTGNLLTIHTSYNATNMDMLINIGK